MSRFFAICVVLLLLVNNHARAGLYIGGEFIYGLYNGEKRTSNFLNASAVGGLRVWNIGIEGSYRPFDYQSRVDLQSNTLRIQYQDNLWSAGFRLFASNVINLKAGISKSTFKTVNTFGSTVTVVEDKFMGYGGLGFVIPVKDVDLFLDYTTHYGTGIMIHEGSAGMRLYLGGIKRKGRR